MSALLAPFTFAQNEVTLNPSEKKEVVQLEKERKRLNDTLWSAESQAQSFEKAFIVPLWNQLLKVKVEDRYAPLAEIPFEELYLPQKKSSREFSLGIHEVRLQGDAKLMTSENWRAFVQSWKDQGYVIEHTDWHQAGYTPHPENPVSEVNFRIQARHEKASRLVEINGKLTLTWAGNDPKKDGAKPKKIDVLNLIIRERSGEPVFKESLLVSDEPFKRIGYLTPANVVFDFNNDGLPEILQGSVGAMFWNKGDFGFEIVPFNKNQDALLDAAVVDDFNGDGYPDLLGVTAKNKLAFYKGRKIADQSSPFEEGIFIFGAPGDGIQSTCTLTSGDADGDGDLDVWIGQWKSPYHVMPKRYYDANDGHSSFLLINDGAGNFSDGTKDAGLGVRQFRRSYSGSFVDLDEDGDQDLLTVNDFAGVDAYHNDGKGRFTLVSDQILDEWHNFGMSHTMGDYNGDGRLDFYVQGMSSTTARRLDRMKAGPENLQDHTKMRGIMGYGNRMYLSQDGGKYHQPAFKDSVARTGWSWGATSLDFDNDSHLDVFVANGHISGKSTQDHCSNFWCHEIYLPEQRTKKNSQKAIMTFLNESLGTPEISWDGYQPNRLMMNLGGEGFVEASFLVGAGHVKDSRNAISADFDADGRMDLLFCYKNHQTDISYMQILQNASGLAAARHWVGVHLQGKAGLPVTGAKVTVKAGSRTFVARQINGDSFQSQHPNSQHFGLGDLKAVDELSVLWPNGKTTVVKSPAIDQYHTLSPN